MSAKLENPLSFLLTTILFLLALTPTLTTAHMEMTYPPPLKSKSNPNAAAANNVDYSMTSPLSADGSNYPCKGYLSLLNTPQGNPVASWAAGGSYNFTIAGGAPHGGGSCQASLSLDGGKTFRVVHSYEGRCPGLAASSQFKFSLPGDVPATKGAVFAWTWFNNLGNREMYMNCAVVDITAGGSGGGGTTTPFASRPAMFAANVGNGCKTVDSANVKFPDPGPDVDAGGSATPPTGTCAAAAGSAGSGSGSGSSGGGSGGSGTGAGSGGSGGGSGAGSTGSGSGNTAPSSAGNSPGGGPATTITPSPSQDPDATSSCQATPRPTGSDSSSEPGKGWTPGNDWPEGFNSEASRRPCGYHYLAVFAWATLFAYWLS